jgi:FkbM family methyltransferase
MPFSPASLQWQLSGIDRAWRFYRGIRAVVRNVQYLKQGSSIGALKYAVCTLLFSKQPVSVSASGRRISVRPLTPDVYVARSCFTGEFAAAINAASPIEHGLVIDAGGYIGAAAIVFAESFPHARIVTLEPSAQNFQVLKQNIKAYKNIIALNAALGTTEGEAPLFDIGDREWAHSLIARSPNRTKPTALHTVQITTIPSILRQLGVRGVDLLKLDIEGGELALFNDPKPWLPLAKVLVVELHEAVAPGCGSAFRMATRGRGPSSFDGEKFLSVAI